ncbi:small subunit ribosomal protein S20 [Halolactibacillus halophilus]|uniref:Small ribosomal subunit protein bS20 n=1 Tax=Halolactibacillus halophilus TaxID=306540 RepID=A0A1I5KV89_9BACI|nr:30S ribosomal protein S20 [Halolactibacillus halophilus]GEM00523.1 30S ribosomal protein S20 [Halolactibacillus halophilus]SFO89030.1 small subunit ribosomal protein S20 [Halolactibacillus halophilus]
MANIKSAKKRIRVNEDARLLNAPVKTEMRSMIKRVENLVNDNKVEDAKAALNVAIKKIDKAVQKGIVHKNNGSRQKSRLVKKVNQLSA